MLAVVRALIEVWRQLRRQRAEQRALLERMEMLQNGIWLGHYSDWFDQHEHHRNSLQPGRWQHDFYIAVVSATGGEVY